MKVDWPKCSDGGLRLDLEAVAFAEYVVGANPDRPHGTGRGVASFAKGQHQQPVALFGSHQEVEDPSGFGRRWLNGDPALGGQDRTRWKMQDAWLVQTMRQPMYARNYRKSPVEQHQFRIRLCPEPSAGMTLAKEGRFEEFARKFMAGVEADFSAGVGGSQHFVWMAGAHHNVDHPHVHIGMRGITVEGEHVYFSQRYLNPTKIEKLNKADASSPIEWRARSVLADMLGAKTGARHAG